MFSLFWQPMYYDSNTQVIYIEEVRRIKRNLLEVPFNKNEPPNDILFQVNKMN